MSEPPAGVDPRLRALAREQGPVGTHPDEETWVALQTGVLSDAARAAVADHIGTCPDCSLIFKAVGALEEAARSKGLMPAGARSGSFSGQRAFVLTAAAALLAALGVAAWLGTRPAPPPSVAASENPPPAQGGPVEATSSRPAFVREWALAVAAPSVELPARYALVTRGSDRDRAFLEAFGAAITPYRTGDYVRAAEALGQVTERFSEVPEADFYLGVARLLAGDAAGARAPLARAERAESVGEEARWFGAVAAERAGARTEADAMLSAICRGKGSYRGRACAVVGTPVVRE
jgi:hypothetical protein